MKKPTQSKTVWVNIIVVAVAALTGIMNTEIIAQYPEVIAYLGAGIGVLNIILRLQTKEPIK